MKHARFRRSAALLSAAAVAVGGLVALNVASSSAAVPTSGDRIVHWTVPGGATEQIRETDIAAPTGQRFTEVYPVGGTSSVVALTNQNRVVVSGDAFTEVPEGVLGAPVRDIDSDGNNVAVVTNSGEVIAWNREGVLEAAPDGLCAAEQVAVAYAVVVVCEDGTVETYGEPAVSDVPDVLSDVQEVAITTRGPAALNGDDRVITWGFAIDGFEEIETTQGKDIATIGFHHAITADGGLVSYGSQHAHWVPEDEGGVSPAILDEGVSSIATDGPYSAFLTTSEGSYAVWGNPNPRQDAIAIRPLPADLDGLRFVSVGASFNHVALIVADTDPPLGPELVTESSVTGAAEDGTVASGATLTGVPATFDPAPGEVTTDWLANGEVIAAASGQTTLTVTNAMIGQQITFRTRATGGGLTEPLDSVTEPITVLAPEGRRVVEPSTVSGPPAVGQFLVGTPATYDSEPSIVSTRWYVDGVEVVEARNINSFMPTQDMVGKEVVFETRATWSADQGSLPPVTSRSEPVTVRVALAEVSPAVIEGEPLVGETLTVATPAVFTDMSDDVVIEHSWLRDFVPVEGATGDSYTLTAADVGSTFIYVATATRFPGESPAFSYHSFAGIGPVTMGPLTITGAPVITGNAYIGEELTVQPAPVSDDTATITYQWKADGTLVGDGSTTLPVLEEYAGQTITVEQIASRNEATEPGDDYATAESEPVGPVTEVPVELTVETEASLTGTPLVGETLTGNPAVYSTIEGVTVTNYWVIGGTQVAADGTTLTLTNEHVGQNIQFRSIATRGEESVPSTSSTVGPVLAVLEATAPPTISGTPQVGQTLTGTGATFSTTEGVTVTHQWYADGAPIDGATGPTLELTDAHLGAEISFESTATRGDDVVSSESAPTTPVTAVPVTVTTAPTISGTPELGETLTGTPAVFSATEGVTVTNRWLADGEPIEGATGNTLKLTPAQLGQTITFESTAIRGEETPVVAASEPVGPVDDGNPPPTGVIDVLLDGPTAPGATITVEVGTDFAGQQVQLYLSNLDRLLPPATVAEDGTIQVLVPGDIALGTHRLAVYSGGDLVGWDDFEVTLVRPEDPAFQDLIDVTPNPVKAGEQVTIQVGADRAGQQVRVVLFSAPTDLGFATVAADGTVRVQIPADLAAGVHRVAVYDINGNLIGWQDLTVTDGGLGAGGRSGRLPAAGADVPGAMVPLGVTFLLAGLGLVAFRARGRHQLS